MATKARFARTAKDTMVIAETAEARSAEQTGSPRLV